ncbi:MAG: cytochrome c [Planctomycetes bacterium]|nr:cytochrome c [Planctomycetota bacterium]
MRLRDLCLTGILLSGCGPVKEPLRPELRSRWMEVVVEPAAGRAEDLLALGERLYGWNCLPCHGPDGKGDGPVADRLALRPRDFTRGWFKFKTSGPDEMPFDEDLYRTISVGVPSSGMPSFAVPLLPEDRWALIAYVKSLSLPPAGAGRNHFEASPPRRLLPSPPPRAGDAGRGARLFREGVQCARCHGDDGRGAGPAAAELVDSVGRPVAMPDLTRGEAIFKTGNRAEDVFRILATGMAGTPMPSFASVPAKDLWDLSAFVTSLYEPIAPGERTYLTSGCIGCHTFGKGRLIGPDLAGVTKRRPRAWLSGWIKDPAEMISRDPEARKLYEEFKSPMPTLRLSDREVEDLIDYLSRLDACGGK